MNQLQQPFNLVKITLEYDNGMKIIVPENEQRAVGQAFVQAVQKRQLNWKVIEPAKKKPNILRRVVGYFREL